MNRLLTVFFLVAVSICHAAEEMIPLRLYSLKRASGAGEHTLPQAVEWLPLGRRDAARQASSCRSAYDDTAVTIYLELREQAPAAADTVEIWLRPPGMNSYRQYLVGRDGKLLLYRHSNT